MVSNPIGRNAQLAARHKAEYRVFLASSAALAEELTGAPAAKGAEGRRGCTTVMLTATGRESADRSSTSAGRCWVGGWGEPHVQGAGGGWPGLGPEPGQVAMFRDPELPAASMFPGVSCLGLSDCVCVLGAPVGDEARCQEWVEENVLAPLRRALVRLEALGDPQCASLVLRQCLSGIRVNWILRTADPVTASWTSALVAPLPRQCWDAAQ